MLEEKLKQQLNCYVQRTEQLLEGISDYMSGKHENEEWIREEYGNLKNEMNDWYRYFSCEKNQISQRGGIYREFEEKVMSAATKGFRVKCNGKINQGMFNAVDDAYDYLTFG